MFAISYGWAMPIVNPLSAIATRRILGREQGCAMRRQGRCPGMEFCADCEWNEGCMVDGTLERHRRRT